MLNSDQLRHLEELVRLIRALPAPPSGLLLPKETNVTCQCGNTVCVSKLQRIQTPLVKSGFSNFCSDCRSPELLEVARKKARFVCVGCGQVVGRVPPHINVETKREIQAGKTYHVLGCPACPPEFRKRVAEAMNPGIIQGELEDKNIAFSSPIFEILYLKNPTHAISCLHRLLSSNPLDLAAPSSTTP